MAVKKICVSIAKNLLQTLTQTFPDKKFIVYLQINNNDSIIRFHQIWNEEPLYFDVKQLRNKDGTEIFEYKYEPGPT
ncbi:hypothetical protein SDC9_151804 [bioreactor metagenome]|uniref:Uncharacterized protein n=1 Tax=bioreactor metagenome TaxID=1076179 RepID=A0A645EVM9_9ZZZZ